MSMLNEHLLPEARLWSRGVDLTHFNPDQRSESLRREWGVGSLADLRERKAASGSAEQVGEAYPGEGEERLSVLYVGRM